MLQTAKIIPKNKRLQPSAGSALAYHFEPESPEQADLGSLLAVVEVLGPTKRAEDIIDQLIQTIGENYYIEKDSEGFDPEQQFSIAIKRANAKLKQILGKDSLSGRISAVAAIVAGDHLYLTAAGAAEGYLFRGAGSTSLTNGLANAEDSKIFSAIASGPVQIGDQIALVTPALLHQISQTELKSIISNTTPTSAVTRLTQLLEGQTNLSRTAAVVASITTPELLSLQARADDPDELQVSDPTTVADSAKEAVAPLIGRTVAALKSGGRNSIHLYRQNIAPAAKSVAQKSLDHSGKALRNPKISKVLPILAVVILVAGIFLWARHAQASQLSNLEKRYHAAYVQVVDADEKLAASDKASAQKDLASAKKILGDLAKNKHLKDLDDRLKTTSHPENDPANVEELQKQVSTRLDQLEGVVRLSGTVVKDFGGDKQGPPSHMELVGGKVLAIGNSGITAFSTSGQQLYSSSAPADMGKVVATTVNTSGDGLLILTDQPALWLFQLSDKSFARQDLSNGALPTSHAIATYNGNVYILGDDAVYKLTPTLAGFSAPVAGIKFSDNPSLGGSRALAIDGSIYIGGGSNGIERYLAGALSGKAVNLPATTGKIGQVRLLDNDVVLGMDGKAGRIEILSLGDTDLTYSKQLVLEGYSSLVDILYDSGSGNVYAISGTKLIKAPYRF
jgi:hypothetical protein